MEKIDGYLSSVAQKLNAKALVLVQEFPDGTEKWILRCPGEDDVGLGENFKRASTAIRAWIRAKSHGSGQRHFPLPRHYTDGPHREDQTKKEK